MAVDVDGYYRQYGPMVLRRCRRLLRDEQKAVDAMQDVFLQLLRHQGRVDGRAPAALLLQMATNLSLNRLRSEKRRPEDADDARVLDIAHSSDLEASSVTRQLLGTIFGRELPSTQTIAVLHLLDGLTLEEVAREVGLSVSGVRKRLRTLKARVSGLEAV